MMDDSVHPGEPVYQTLPNDTLVSILNWNGTDDTLRCLAALDRQNAPELHFIVLDNGSRIDPTDRFADECPDVEFIRVPENLGFAGGHNHVMHIALQRGFGSVLLLNNDCQLTIADIRAMRAEMAADAKLAAVSPLVYRDDGSRRPMMVAGWFDWSAHRTVRPNSPDALPPPGAQAFLVGTALLLRSTALREIGLLDERYFAYYEDNDISARIARAGWRATHCKGAVCLHDYRGLHEYSPTALYLMARNAWLFWRDHTPPEARRGLRRSIVATTLHDLALLQKNRASAERRRALLAGFWDGMRGRYGAPPAKHLYPRWLGAIAGISPYLFSQLIQDPVNAVRNRIKSRQT